MSRVLNLSNLTYKTDRKSDLCHTVISRNMGEKCLHCGQRFSRDIWSCTKCGWPREVCPECGSDVGREDKVCAECGAVRQRACEECESLIDATKSQCR
ncbi:double zinc ribbon domain-containing protein [Halobellus sp. EA9]|uniref:double zinc ribbon domain-containing protein n=1 Tax=Halobellus sp. EA9 TaxID=3421647 RepID=UPI003EBD945A